MGREGYLTPEGLQMMQALQDRLDAIAAVSDPTGGGTQDAEARTAIAAIIDAAEG